MTLLFPTACECADPGCANVNRHMGDECGQPTDTVVRRIDMDDGETTFNMCAECADDALGSGVFA